MIYATVLWLALSTLLGCALSFIAGELTPLLSGLSLLSAFIACVFAYRHRAFRIPARPVSLPIALLYAFIGFGIYIHSVFLFFKKDNYWWIQDPFNLGDMSFHWGVIRYLAKGAHFWPENPIFMGHRFRYPFGMDLFNAFFESLHVPMATHLPLATLACLLITLYLLHSAGGPLLVFAIFFSGGIYNFLQPGAWSLTDVQAGLDFKNLFLAVLLTQRGFLYALPAGLLLYQALRASFAKAWIPNTAEKVGFGIIWGALGFFHLHSFFFLSLYLGAFILWQRQFLLWRWTVLIAALVGAPFVLNAIWPEAGTSSLIHLSRGWARGPDTNYVIYWLQNLGPWIATMLTASVYFFSRKRWNDFFPLVLALSLFVIFAHLILAPWDWDNVKLLMWCYIFGLLAVSDWLWDSRGAIVQTFVFAIFFLPGYFLFVHSLPAFNHGISWVSDRELNKAEVLLTGHDVNLGMVIAPAYDHTALLLGYKLYMGYPGHVWSHGYNYADREAILARYFNGDKSAVGELKNAQVHLLYQGPFEKQREPEGGSTFSILSPDMKLGQAFDHELYKLD